MVNPWIVIGFTDVEGLTVVVGQSCGESYCCGGSKLRRVLLLWGVKVVEGLSVVGSMLWRVSLLKLSLLWRFTLLWSITVLRRVTFVLKVVRGTYSFFCRSTVVIKYISSLPTLFGQQTQHFTSNLWAWEDRKAFSSGMLPVHLLPYQMHGNHSLCMQTFAQSSSLPPTTLPNFAPLHPCSTNWHPCRQRDMIMMVMTYRIISMKDKLTNSSLGWEEVTDLVNGDSCLNIARWGCLAVVIGVMVRSSDSSEGTVT